MTSKKLVIDADTIAVRNAAFCQTNYEFLNKETGESAGNYTSQRHFYEKLQEGDSKDNYEMVRVVKPAIPKNGDEPQVIGYHGAKRELEKIITRYPDVTEYEVCIHGSGNFRDEAATIQPYKGTRNEKPIFTQDLKDYIVRKYKDNCTVVNDEETDDYVSRMGWESYYRCKDKKNYTDMDVIIAHVDKDLDQVPGIHYNYDKDELYHVSVWDAAYSFWGQMLEGDTTDNIPGIPKISKEFKKEYKLRTAKGFGKKTVESYLSECTTPKEMAERVVLAYKDAYGDKWLDIAQEVGTLLYMRREEGAPYSFTESLDRLGVEYG